MLPPTGKPRLRHSKWRLGACDGDGLRCRRGGESTALVVRSDVVVHGGDLAVERVPLAVDVRKRVRVGAVPAVACGRNVEETS